MKWLKSLSFVEIVLLVIILLKLRKPLEKAAIDSHNAGIIEKLNPIFKPIVIDFIQQAENKNYFVWLTDGTRSPSWQPIGRLDFHHFGVAFDCNLIEIDITITDLSKATWLRKSDSVADWLNTNVPQIAINNFQLRWGGYFTIKDTVHFDMGKFYDINSLIALSEQNPNVPLNELNLSHA